MTSIGKIQKRERKIIVKMYQFAKELSNSDNPQLYELGHYLTDNIISKICMLVAIENNQTFTRKTHKGKEISLSFYELYKGILKKKYPSVPDYKEIERLHDERNIYQHEARSISYHLNSQYALDYLEKVREIMLAINMVDSNSEIEPTTYFSGDSQALPDNETKKKNKEIQKMCIDSLQDKNCEEFLDISDKCLLMRFLWDDFDNENFTYDGKFKNDSIKKIATLIKKKIMKSS